MKVSKMHIITILIFIGIITVSFIPKIAFSVDSRLISKNLRPIFVLNKGMALDGGTTEFRGLGYQIIRWNRLVTDGIEYGYEIYKIPNYRSLSDGPTTNLKLIKSQPSE